MFVKVNLSFSFHKQVVLIVSGNLSFLNWLTIVPSLACFDDASLGFLFGARRGARKEVLDLQHEDAAGQTPKPTKGIHARVPCVVPPYSTCSLTCTHSANLSTLNMDKNEKSIC